jgi:Ser/Thr protein kinase RdoA (MazF antagonist)
VADAADEYQCDLLSWVDGQPLGSAEERSYADNDAVARTYLAAGQLAARLHDHSAGWRLPADFERHSWDEAGCLGPSALWGDWNDNQDLTVAERELLAAAVPRALATLAAFGKASDRYGLIHSDFVPDNLLDDGTRTVIIDFDDCGFGWHLWELATAVFWHFGAETYDPALESLVDGYRQHRSLPDEHLDLLPAFLFVRGLVYLGWCHTRRETETAAEIYDFVVETTSAMAERLLAT